MGTQEFIIFITVIIILLLSGTILILFLLFSRRKNQLFQEKKEIEENFEKEITSAKVEIREETLRNISWELHDNIGQLITLAKIQVQQIPDNPSKIKNVSDTISQALLELRSLSKVINPDTISKLSLVNAINLEIERCNRMKFIEAELNVSGEPYRLDTKKEIILFRIMQEFFTNTLKHAQATKLEVHLFFYNDYLTITAKDNGNGFRPNEETQGIGITNMENRAKLIGAEIFLDAKLSEGTTLTLKLPKAS